MLTNHLGILLITQIDKIKRLTPQQANLKANTSSLAEVTLLHAKVRQHLACAALQTYFSSTDLVRYMMSNKETK